MTRHARERVWTFLLIAASAHAASCADVPADDEPEPSAQPASLQRAPGSLPAAELARRRDAIRAHFAQRRSRLPIVATTVTDEGQTIDWIPRHPDVDALPSLESLASSHPNLAAAMAQPRDRPANAMPAQTVLDLEPWARGPEGTVPVARFDVEGYLANEPNPPADPRDVLRHMPPPASELSGHYYVAWQRTAGGPFSGAGAQINLWDGSGPPALPTVESNIAQVFVSRGVDSAQQTVEAGKIEMRSLNGGSAYPYLFVYYTTNNHGDPDDWTGGYNANVDGWVQASSTITPGLPFGSVSTRDGMQYYAEISVIGPGGTGGDGRWYVVMNGIIVGWYPRCKHGDTSSTCTTGGYLFSSAGLRATASNVYVYGEVGGTTTAAKTTDMGSGAFANEGFARAAYFDMVRSFKPGGGSSLFTSSDFLRVTDSGCYSRWWPTPTPGHNRLFYGGPGRDAASCR